MLLKLMKKNLIFFLIIFTSLILKASTIKIHVFNPDGNSLNSFSISLKKYKSKKIAKLNSGLRDYILFKNLTKALWFIRVSKDGYYPYELLYFENHNKKDIIVRLKKTNIKDIKFKLYIKKGTNFFLNWKNKKAISVFRKLLNKIKDPHLVKISALLYYNMRKYKKVINLLKKYRNKDQRDLYMLLFSFLELDDYKNALKILSIIDINQPFEPEVGIKIGNFLYDREEYKRAIPFLKKSKEVDPQNPKSYYFLGLSYAALNRKELAIKNLKEYIRLDPDSANTVIADSVIRAFNEINKKEKKHE